MEVKMEDEGWVIKDERGQLAGGRTGGGLNRGLC
jgi:hypothetical protein